jgi:hypothetical protein
MIIIPILCSNKQQKNKLRGLSLRANYTDRATAGDLIEFIICQLFQVIIPFSIMYTLISARKKSHCVP